MTSGYDGGDCCACTCESTVDYTCGDPDTGGYACIDPSADCVDDDDVESTTYTDPEYTEEFACNNGWLSDGLCDSINNKEDCGTWMTINVLASALLTTLQYAGSASVFLDSSGGMCAQRCDLWH